MTPVVCDVFEQQNLCQCVEAARPDVVIHQLTALPQRIDPRKIKSQLAETNRLRSAGTRNLFDASLAAGAKRFIAQSIVFAYSPHGDGLKTEDSALYERPPASYVDVIEAVRSLEETTLSSADVPGVVLRYGVFYGSGTVYASDGSFAQDVRRKRVPIIGKGTGVYSFVHVEDVAAATVAALENGELGIYNIVDDEPAPVADWLPFFASTLGACRPSRVPRWLARVFAGPYAIYLFCDQRGAANVKAKGMLFWLPKNSTWRNGFKTVS